MAVVRGERNGLRRQDRGQGMLVLGPVDSQHRLDARQRRGLRGHRGGILAENGERDFRIGDGHRARDAFGGRGVQVLAVVLADYQYLVHQIKPFFFNTSTSSATSFTMMPRWRCAGGSVFTVLRYWPALTPSASKVVTSSGFFLAFMMSGSLT